MHCIALTVLISIHISFVIIYYSHICSREISSPHPPGEYEGWRGVIPIPQLPSPPTTPLNKNGVDVVITIS